MSTELTLSNISPETRDLLDQVDTLIGAVRTIEVVDHDSYERGGADRTLLGALAAALTTQRLEITRPLDQRKAEAMAFFKPPIERIEVARRELEAKLLSFTKALKEAQEAEQRRLDDEARAKEEAERARLAALAEVALEQGNQERAESLIVKAEEVRIPSLQLAPQKVPSQSISTRTIWKFRIIDELKIPRNFLMVDEAKIRQWSTAAKGAFEIPGIEFYSEEIIAGKRGAL